MEREEGCLLIGRPLTVKVGYPGIRLRENVLNFGSYSAQYQISERIRVSYFGATNAGGLKFGRGTIRPGLGTFFFQCW